MPHVLLVGKGAARFAKDIKAEESDNLSSEAHTAWLRWLSENRNEKKLEIGQIQS